MRGGGLVLSIQSILSTVRVAVHDTDAIEYDDKEIVSVINAGLRFIRRTIIELQPEILSETIVGELAAGENTVLMEKRPAAIVEITAGDNVKTSNSYRISDKIYHNYNPIYNNKTPIYAEEIVDKTYYENPLQAINLRHVNNKDEEGVPRAFYRTGLRAIHFVPIPNKTTGYTIRYVPDLDEVTLADNSPLLTEYDDFLIEYATIRLSIGNEYDVSQEQVIMGNIVSQIQNMLFPPPPGVRVRGYWDNGPRRGDY